MKNLIYSSMLFLATVFIFSCGPCPDCPGEQENDYKANLKDTISEAKYDIWVTNWKTYGQSYTINTAMEYYTMPTIDLNEFLQFPGTGRDTVAAARFVLGMEISGLDTMPHLMLVGVNAAGQSMTDAAKQQYIYDVTAPCPNSCGINSLPK